MTTELLFIPTLFGLSIEVYFILIILGIPTFFFWRWLFKKYIKVNKTRKLITWIATIILTPLIYVGIVMLIYFSISYYPSHDFDRQKWLTDGEKRYELSKDLINSKILIGKSKVQVRQLLGDEADNENKSNVWTFGLGYRPELFNIDPDHLQIEFKDDKVVNVEQHMR
jgi:hypothetical protein